MLSVIDKLLRMYKYALYWCELLYSFGVKTYSVLMVFIKYSQIYYEKFINAVSNVTSNKINDDTPADSKTNLTDSSPETRSRNESTSVIDEDFFSVEDENEYEYDKSVSEKSVRFVRRRFNSSTEFEHDEDVWKKIMNFTDISNDYDSSVESEDNEDFMKKFSRLIDFNNDHNSPAKSEEILKKMLNIPKIPCDNRCSTNESENDENILEKSVHDLNDEDWDIMYTKIKQIINNKFKDNNEHEINQDLEPTDSTETKFKL